MIMSITDRRVPIKCDSKRVRPESSEVNALISNNFKADRLLGWAPTIDFVRGLRMTVEFMKLNKDKLSTEYGV
jgi:GDP-D-mannose dehydratase